jgi:dihydropyrimidinase
VDTVATDHAPFDFVGQKEMGRDNFTLIPNGIPSLEERVKLLFSYGVAAGRLDRNRFVEVASTRAAKLFGLFPRKGTIQLGADADLVVYDPNFQGVITAENHQSAVDYNAFEGWAVQGRPDTVTVRGQVQIRNGQFVGTIGRGQFLRRETTQ